MKRHIDRAWFRRSVITLIIIILCCSAVIPIYIIYRKEGERFSSYLEHTPDAKEDYILVDASLTTVDMEDRQFHIHFEFTPYGKYRSPNGLLASGLTFNLYTQSVSFPINENMRALDAIYTFYEGNIVEYPFDQYEGYFELFAHHYNNFTNPIPISLKLDTSVHSVKSDPSIRKFTFDTDKIGVLMKTRRSDTTIAFSVFVGVLMWVICASFAYLAFQAVVKRRQVDSHFCSLGIALLFALPAMRDSQPGVPKTGCAADVMGFYWNMAICAVSSVAVLMTYGLRWKRELDKKRRDICADHDCEAGLNEDTSAEGEGSCCSCMCPRNNSNSTFNSSLRTCVSPTQCMSPPSLPAPPLATCEGEQSEKDAKFASNLSVTHHHRGF
ncbi:uncharacterized protein VTP21DRAFT_2282 [Calcarisporiella thermophila]|uniref:uncharacterized protein n=1 Tax=Calcarisporiella thermophila TaxID=911321 RepID=UPI0037428218